MSHATSNARPHALAQALSRSAGFALLRPASRPDLDATRILTMSGTLAINLIAMGLLMMPLAMPPPTISVDTQRHDPLVRQIQKETPVEVEIVERVKDPTVAPRPIQLQTTAPPRHQASDVVISATGTELAVDDTIAEDAGMATDMGNSISTAPTAVQLEYLMAPAPRYPRGALTRRIEGTVLLQVLVGIDGQPLDVTVSQSSGNRELDEAARSQILKRWSFRPAMKNGHAVQALGLVPIEFKLHQ